MGVLLKLMFGMLGLFALAFGAAQALRNARRLDRRIARFKAEQEELEAQGRVAHPYMALSHLQSDSQSKSLEDEAYAAKSAKSKSKSRLRNF